MIPDGKVLVLDGVAVLARGDTFLVVYQSAARLQRTRWLFDHAQQLFARNSDGILVFMVVLPTADPPDAPTRAENSARLRKLGGGLRRLVTTPVGDAFRTSIVRTVMRALAAVSGKSSVQFVANTVSDGISRLLEAAGPKTPTRQQIEEDLHALHQALGVETPR